MLNRAQLVDDNLTDLSSLIRIVQEHRPDDVYNLAEFRRRFFGPPFPAVLATRANRSASPAPSAPIDKQ